MTTSQTTKHFLARGAGDVWRTDAVIATATPMHQVYFTHDGGDKVRLASVGIDQFRLDVQFEGAKGTLCKAIPILGGEQLEKLRTKLVDPYNGVRIGRGFGLGIRSVGNEVLLELTGRVSDGSDRIELALAPFMMEKALKSADLLGEPVSRIRYTDPLDDVFEFDGDAQRRQVTVEIDEYTGANEGLVVCSLQKRADTLVIPPAYFGQQVPDDLRLTDTALAETPYSTWAPAATLRV